MDNEGSGPSAGVDDGELGRQQGKRLMVMKNDDWRFSFFLSLVVGHWLRRDVMKRSMRHQYVEFSPSVALLRYGQDAQLRRPLNGSICPTLHSNSVFSKQIPPFFRKAIEACTMALFEIWALWTHNIFI